jgi:hypothetical protein
MSNAAPKTIEGTNIVPMQGQALTPMELIDRALTSGASVETLEKMMGLQERFEKNQARKAFDEAVALAKAEIKPIARSSTGHNSKKYADFAAIARAVDPIITKHGLNYRFRSSQDDGRISVTCVLSHKLGHSEETTLSGPADASGNKNAIQAIGSTLTYLQRYSLVQMLGLAASDDDDGKAVAGASDETVSDEQLEKIRTRIVAVGVDIPVFCKVMKVEAVDQVLAKDFDLALRRIKEVEDWNKQAEKKGGKP